MGGSAVDDSLNASDIGLPSSVCSSVRMGDLDAECYALFAEITLCHFSAPPYNKLHNKDYNNTDKTIKQEKKRFFTKKFFAYASAKAEARNVPRQNRIYYNT